MVEASLAAGHHEEVLAQAAAMVEAAPLRERRWALLAQAQYQAGHQMEALRTLRRIRVVLRASSGSTRGPDLVALEQAILRQDPELAVDAAARGPGDDVRRTPGSRRTARPTPSRSSAARPRCGAAWNGWLGPAPGDRRASGSGKSSLLRAGLAAALRRDGTHTWCSRPAVTRWTPSPRRARAQASVVLVDQAEEAFAPVPRRRARAVLRRTGRPDRRGRVVLALRADHTGDLARAPGLAALVERGLFLLRPMSPESLRSAIESPARQHGSRPRAGAHRPAAP